MDNFYDTDNDERVGPACRAHNIGRRRHLSLVAKSLLVASAIVATIFLATQLVQQSNTWSPITPRNNDTNVSINVRPRRRLQKMYEYNQSPSRGDNGYSQYVGYHARGRNTDQNRSFYGYPEDDPEKKKNWLAQKYDETNIKDVWICFLLAVAWGSWMFGSFVKSDLLRYGQDSIRVKGNVRQVTRVDHSLGTGIPIYKVIIDYIIPAQLCAGQYGYPPPGMSRPSTPANFASQLKAKQSDLSEGPSLQIRKEFETLHPLQQGFGNVELLVLHHEPTTSILKEDWEQQVMEEMEESRARRRTQPHCCGCLTALCRCMDDLFCGYGKDAYGERIVWKRIWVAFCLFMMLVSMGGSVLAAHRLPKDSRRLGWLCVCLQSMLLIPTALAIRLAITSCQRNVFPEGRAAFVVSNNPSPETTPRKTDHLQHAGLSWEENGQKDGHFCMDPSEVLDVQVCDKDEVITLEQTHQHYQTQKTGGNDYVVRVTEMQREESDLSDISSNSRTAPLNPIVSESTRDSVDSRRRLEEKETPVESGVMT